MTDRQTTPDTATLDGSADDVLFIPRGMEYLGILGTKLGDLSGFATLAHELIQNADDTEGATWIRFDVSDESLTIDNDGVFSDCGHSQTTPQCPWLTTPSIQHRCDFHSFRLVGSGDKRLRTKTTGAFGIGFIAAYQITDHPNLISAGKHWILDETQEESKRIRGCRGCERCAVPGLPPTRFILPWARDPNSPLRTALRASAISDENISSLDAELHRALPTALLFLKRLERIEFCRNGAPVLTLSCVTDGDTRLISDGTSDHIWRLFHGTFSSDASSLRQRYPTQIEEKRTADVTIAIPTEHATPGLLCLCLPTQQETGLPFHINADFFPTSDRKKLDFEGDYESEWNRAALGAAARALRSALPALPSLISPERLWQLILALHTVHDDATQSRREPHLATFWTEVAPLLSSAPIALTSRRTWARPSETVILRDDAEEASLPILEELGLSIFHPSIRPLVLQLPYAKTLQTELLTVPTLATALRQAGLDKHTPLSTAPTTLRTRSGLTTLWQQCERLLVRRTSNAGLRETSDDLATCAIALSDDGDLYPPNALYHASAETISLFTALSPSLHFLAAPTADYPNLHNLSPAFLPADAAAILSRLSGEDVASILATHDRTPSDLLSWFDSRKAAILSDNALKQSVANCPICPTATDLLPLTAVSLPGDFEDHLHLAALIDLARLGNHRDFLVDLGVSQLTFLQYVTQHVPRALAKPDALSTAEKRALTHLLSSRLSSIRDNSLASTALSPLPLIECQDATFLPGTSTYFPDSPAVALLGPDVPAAALPPQPPQSLLELYGWLGVEHNPRSSDLLSRVSDLTSSPPTPQTREAIQQIFAYLSRHYAAAEALPVHLASLTSARWLPARGRSDRWYAPTELYAAFQDYLFDSQAFFLDVRRDVQIASTKLLSLLHIKDTPAPSLVVSHLLYCASVARPVNREVYRFLSNEASDPSIERLQGTPCIILADNTYISPFRAFWNPHPFGNYRVQLGSEFRTYETLFSKIGVKDNFDASDVVAVLSELASSNPHSRLDDTALTICHNCWAELSRLLDADTSLAQKLQSLSDQKVIPDPRLLLEPPSLLLFEGRAGLAAKFDDTLRHNIIQRQHSLWPAMEAAGVTTLSDRVAVTVVENPGIKEASEISARVQDRRHHLLRVLATHLATPATALAILDNLTCWSAEDIQLQYSLVGFLPRSIHSKIESAPCHYDSEQRALLFVPREGVPPWASIARELSFALSPDTEPGQLAPAVKEVLSAPDSISAHSILDELGFPPLAAAPRAADTLPSAAAALGGEEITADDGPFIDTPPPAPLGDLGGSPVTPPGARASDTSAPVAHDLPDQGRQVGPHTDSPPAASTPVTGEPAPQPAGDAPNTGVGAGTPKPRQPAFTPQTYVAVHPNGHQSADLDQDSPAAARQREVDAAGIEHVRSFEVATGRTPQLMPHGNPGYDIWSRDLDNEDSDRYIEVKSTAGLWKHNPRALSRFQFNKGHQVGDKYWLYIVENADQPSARIYRIHDPARRAENFVFDAGWLSLAEADDSANDARTAPAPQLGGELHPDS